MPWWSSGADPKWRPPRAQRPGAARDRLRDRLNEIIGDETRGEDWLKALAERLPGEAIEAFLDHKQMTADELRTISGFCSEFGEDMASGRLVRRGDLNAPPVSPGPRSRNAPSQQPQLPGGVVIRPRRLP
jgi:hypothetical protein